MRKILQIISCMFFVAVASSCALLNSNTLYDAPALPVPLHQEKGGFTASAGHGGFLGANAAISYAFAKHTAVMASGNIAHHNWMTTELGILGTHVFRLRNHSIELGLGRFKKINFLGFNVLESYVGYGIGQENKRKTFSFTRLSSQYDGPQGQYRKFFIQANIGKVRPSYDFAFSTRLSTIRFSKLSYVSVSRSGYNDYTTNLDNTQLYYAEPAFTFAYGKSKIKFLSQLGCAIPVAAFTQGQANGHRKGSIIFNLGLKMALGRIN